MRANYWSCSRFADWIRGIKKGGAKTGLGWQEWELEGKAKHPIRFWIAEEALDAVQNFLLWPSDRLHDIRYYINNRWVSRTHGLTAHPRDIEPGKWCDVGNRFLPCLFNELVDFVEIETAWHHVLWDEKARRQYEVPWWRRGFMRWRTWRCPAAGIAHLEWAMELTNVEFLDEDEKHLAEPTHQARAAREILALYRWWTEEYPRRPDPYDASGWSAYCDMRRERGYNFFDMENKSEEEKEMCDMSHKRLCEIEEAYKNEDEEMMIRLIKIRESLWT